MNKDEVETIEIKVLKDIEEHFKNNDNLVYADFCNIFLKHDKNFKKLEKGKILKNEI